MSLILRNKNPCTSLKIYFIVLKSILKTESLVEYTDKYLHSFSPCKRCYQQSLIVSWIFCGC